MFEWSPGNQTLYLDKDLSPIDDNGIEDSHEKDVEIINDEDSQEMLSYVQEQTTYVSDSGSNRNEEYDKSNNYEEGSSEEEI